MTQTFGPYSPIYQANDLYFVSGQIGVDPETKQAGKNIQEQTAQVMMNLTSVLATQGLGLDDVAKTTIYLTDMSNFEQVNAIYDGYFTPNTPRPARATVGVAGLPRVGGDNSLLVEIEAVAKRGHN